MKRFFVRTNNGGIAAEKACEACFVNSFAASIERAVDVSREEQFQRQQEKEQEKNTPDIQRFKPKRRPTAHQVVHQVSISMQSLKTPPFTIAYINSAVSVLMNNTPSV